MVFLGPGKKSIMIIIKFSDTDARICHMITGLIIPNDYGINYTYNTEGDLIAETRWGEGPMFAVYDIKFQYERVNGLKTVIYEVVGRKHKTEYRYDQDGDLVKESEYECDENGNFEATPYYTELYVYQ